MNLLKSAVYQFVKKNKRMPYELQELIRPYPDNYLSGLPEGDGVRGEKKKYDGEGGWVYEWTNESIENMTELELQKYISMMVNFNYHVPKCSEKCKFEPFEIRIGIKEKELRLISGSTVLASFSVSVGKENRTPIGKFAVSQKISNPLGNNGSDKPYGTRGMVLSDTEYAIHGTYEEWNIGKEVSMGCIRLKNGDIELLYSIIPIGTSVNIAEELGSSEVEPLFAGGSGADSGGGFGQGNGEGVGLAKPNESEVLKDKIFGWLE